MKPDVLSLVRFPDAATVETRNRIGRLMIDDISAHFAGKPLLTPVPYQESAR